MKRCEAPDCTNDFEPKRSTARYCSATCRQRANRSRRAAASVEDFDARGAADQADADADQAAGSEHELVKAVRRELADAEALGTVAGQLALQVARRIVDPDGSGISALSKELRSLLAEAKAAVPTAGTSQPPAPGETGSGPGAGGATPPTPLDRARSARDAKLAAAQSAGPADESGDESSHEPARATADRA